MPVQPQPFQNLLSGRRQAQEEFRLNQRFQSQQLNDAITRAIQLRTAPLQIQTLQARLDESRLRLKALPDQLEAEKEKAERERKSGERAERIGAATEQNVIDTAQRNFEQAGIELEAAKRTNSPEGIKKAEEKFNLAQKQVQSRIDANLASAKASEASARASDRKNTGPAPLTAEQIIEIYQRGSSNNSSTNTGQGLTPPTDPLKTAIPLTPIGQSDLKAIQKRLIDDPSSVTDDIIEQRVRVFNPDLDDGQVSQIVSRTREGARVAPIGGEDVFKAAKELELQFLAPTVGVPSLSGFNGFSPSFDKDSALSGFSNAINSDDRFRNIPQSQKDLLISDANARFNRF